MDFYRNEEEDRGLEDNPETDYAEKLARGDWLLARADFDVRNNRPPAGISPDKDPIADLLREQVGVWHWDRSLDFRYYFDATPWVASATDIFELGCKGKTEEQRRAEGWPSTPEETDRRLWRVIRTLQVAEPSPFWNPGHSEWCEDSRMGSANSPHRYKDAYLYAELWRNGDTLEELYAFVALKPWDWREPRPTRTIARAVYRHVCFLNREPQPVMEEEDDYLL